MTDFIVSTLGPLTWLVDVKGRRFPSGDIYEFHSSRPARASYD